MLVKYLQAYGFTNIVVVVVLYDLEIYLYKILEYNVLVFGEPVYKFDNIFNNILGQCPCLATGPYE